MYTYNELLGIKNTHENSLIGKTRAPTIVDGVIKPTHFRDPNIDARVFFVAKFKELPGATVPCFAFSTTVPKNSPKKGPKFF